MLGSPEHHDTVLYGRAVVGVTIVFIRWYFHRMLTAPGAYGGRSNVVCTVYMWAFLLSIQEISSNTS
jgi:hypothetical protein